MEFKENNREVCRVGTVKIVACDAKAPIGGSDAAAASKKAASTASTSAEAEKDK